MTKVPKSPISAQTRIAQEKRAALLRKRIRELATGAAPDGGRDPTPREFTDDAARKAWEAQQRRKKAK